MSSLFNRLSSKAFNRFSKYWFLRNLYSSNVIVRRILRAVFRQTLAEWCNFEISTYCNAKCVFCSHPFLTVDRSRLVNMSEDTFSSGLDYIRMSGTSVVTLVPRIGENLCNKKWNVFLGALLSEKCVTRVDMITNGILLDEHRLQQLLELDNLHKLSLHFSVGGIDSETYKFMYGVDKYYVVKSNINRLLEEFKKRNMRNPIFAEIRVPDLEKLDLKDVKKTLNPVDYVNFGVAATDEFSGLNGLSQAKEKGLKVVNTHREIERPCNYLRNLSFNSDGSVGACNCIGSVGVDRSQLILGSVDDDISVINERRKKLISDWQKNKNYPEECLTCDFYNH